MADCCADSRSSGNPVIAIPHQQRLAFQETVGPLIATLGPWPATGQRVARGTGQPGRAGTPDWQCDGLHPLSQAAPAGTALGSPGYPGLTGCIKHPRSGVCSRGRLTPRFCAWRIPVLLDREPTVRAPWARRFVPAVHRLPRLRPSKRGSRSALSRSRRRFPDA